MPSGPLTQLPFHVLVSEEPAPGPTGTDAFRRAAWLAKSNAITVLPAVSSLKALARARQGKPRYETAYRLWQPVTRRSRRSDFECEPSLARARQQCAKTPLPHVGPEL